MKPEHRIKRELLLSAGVAQLHELGTAEAIDAVWDERRWDDDYCDQISDTEGEFRQGQVKTELPTSSSRHYECYEVAHKFHDGVWVGWTFWFGGEKWGQPRDIE